MGRVLVDQSLKESCEFDSRPKSEVGTQRGRDGLLSPSSFFREARFNPSPASWSKIWSLGEDPVDNRECHFSQDHTRNSLGGKQSGVNNPYPSFYSLSGGGEIQ